MLEVGIIGIGNAGNQVASLAKEKLNIPVIAINSSGNCSRYSTKEVNK